MDQTAIPWIMMVSTGIAAVSAWFSSRSSRTTADVAATSLVLKFREQYGSNRMLFDLRNLRAWHAIHADKFPQTWAQKVEENDKEALIIDGARRRVSSFCGVIIDLHDAGLLPPRIEKLLTDFDGLDVFYFIVEPLERALVDRRTQRRLLCRDRQRRAKARLCLFRG